MPSNRMLQAYYNISRRDSCSTQNTCVIGVLSFGLFLTCKVTVTSWEVLYFGHDRSFGLHLTWVLSRSLMLTTTPMQRHSLFTLRKRLHKGELCDISPPCLQMQSQWSNSTVLKTVCCSRSTGNTSWMYISRNCLPGDPSHTTTWIHQLHAEKQAAAESTLIWFPQLTWSGRSIDPQCTTCR